MATGLFQDKKTASESAHFILAPAAGHRLKHPSFVCKKYLPCFLLLYRTEPRLSLSELASRWFKLNIKVTQKAILRWHDFHHSAYIYLRMIEEVIAVIKSEHSQKNEPYESLSLLS